MSTPPPGDGPLTPERIRELVAWAAEKMPDGSPAELVQPDARAQQVSDLLWETLRKSFFGEWPQQSAAPDYAEHVVAYRAWRLQSELYRREIRPSRDGTYEHVAYERCWLTSLFNENEPPWPPDQWLRARCLSPSGRGSFHPAPAYDCTCGVYAARTREHLFRQRYHEEPGPLVLGEVALAGRVIEHERGWRAERARPLRLWLPHGDWRQVQPLAETYNVPVALGNPLVEQTPDSAWFIPGGAPEPVKPPRISFDFEALDW